MRIRGNWALPLLFALTAPADVARSHSSQSSAINSQLEACNRAKYRRTDTARISPLTATIRSFGQFSIAVPKGARLLDVDTVGGTVRVQWPGCPRYCRFAVDLRSDSGRTADQRVAALIKEQRKIDSINKVPGGVMEFGIIDGPPMRIRTAAGPAWLIDNDCGDCATYTLLSGRRGQIASVNYSGDDMQPTLPLYLCEMRAVALTFNWVAQVKER